MPLPKAVNSKDKFKVGPTNNKRWQAATRKMFNIPIRNQQGGGSGGFGLVAPEQNEQETLDDSKMQHAIYGSATTTE